jgi:transcription-repair coupling factor (superfamily II helicase)
MLAEIKKKIFSTEEFLKLSAIEPTTSGPIFLRGVSGSLWAFIAAYLFEEFQRQIFLVVSEKDSAEKLRDDCAQLFSEANVRLYAMESIHAGQALDMTATISQVETLKALSAKLPGVYVTHASALAFRVPPKEQFAQSIIELSAGSDTNFGALLSNLADRGFDRKPLVETYGDFAVRGGIVDVFPFIGENPIRLEFWGDTIESIREFDALSQRSIRELQTVSIIPDLATLRSEHTRNVSLADFFSSDAILLTDDPLLIEKEIQELESEGVSIDFSFDAVSEIVRKFPSYIHSVIHKSSEGLAIDFHSTPQPPTNGSVKILIGQIKKLSEKRLDFVIASDTEEESQRIRELIEEAGSQEGDSLRTKEIRDSPIDDTASEMVPQSDLPRIDYISETLHSGFIFPSARIALFTEHEIFGRLKRRGAAKRRRFKGISPKELHSLRYGDFVVHIDHGIGRFLGLEKISLRGTEQEVVRLEYDEKGVLFVNLNYVNRIQKYSSAEGHTPKLSKLGGSEWERLKSRAKKKIKDIARDLILLYAKRKQEAGVAFSPDAHWQKEMEASFMFEDTPDQAAATADVKKDMESASPMDRLICGDVGFGKTEVAVRAAFKVVLDNKQVAVLVPTTILAEQHFSTFSDRLSRYPVRIAAMSRFKSPKKQRTIIEGLKEGSVDIVIGTHRLLSKDVKFKDLGLLVIDEEQRFGVAAKEKLRALRTNVDTLTLTATPIPRTLHFSLMGARDLSIINTPPRNRLPIYTEIAQFDKKIVREAVLRELHRGGQAYIVNDRVENIDSFAFMLHEFIPEARFRVAHGQLKGHELEKVMLDFLEKKCDVLVATKIIESGLDIPNVNTIIINRADRFGLAELYQLRGRVGRSNVQAYAYLLVPPISILPKTTLRRLQAIEEFTELGSGFNLAMRDLEIRGAGNMLGGEQSGFILEMGFEMYTKTLEEAVGELKEQEFSELFAGDQKTPVRTDTIIEADVDAYLPEFYIEDDSERLDIYRRLYKTQTVEAADEIRLELVDRFGSAVEEVENLFMLSNLRVLAATAGFRKIELNKRMLRLHFPSDAEKEFYEGGSFQAIMAKAGELQSHKLQFKQEGKQILLYTALVKEAGPERILEALELLKQLRTNRAGNFNGQAQGAE